MSDIKQEMVHCHTHTIYSINDSIIKIPALFQTIKDYNMQGVVITEHGNIRCLPELIEESQKTGVDFKIGCEIYFTPYDRLNDEDENTNHLIIIPKNQVGYHNFIKIVSDAGLNKRQVIRMNKNMKKRRTNKYYERTDFSILEKYGEGIIGTSACLGGTIPKLLLEDKYSEALEITNKFKECLDDFYLELQTSEDKDQLILNTMLLKLAKDTNTKCIITSDCHYIQKSNKLYHDILLLAAERSPYKIDSNYIMNQEQVEFYCDKYKLPRSLITNTSVLYNSIEEITYIPKDKTFFLPKFPVPKGYTEDTYLIRETKKGLIKKFETQNVTNVKTQRKYLKQADYELNQNIIPKGFSGYFLILADLIKNARNKGILTGPGRGSAASSIVSYATGITSIDPIKNGFIFERIRKCAR